MTYSDYLRRLPPDMIRHLFRTCPPQFNYLFDGTPVAIRAYRTDGLVEVASDSRVHVVQPNELRRITKDGQLSLWQVAP